MPITTKGVLGLGRGETTTMSLPLDRCVVSFNGNEYHRCLLDIVTKELSSYHYPGGREITSITMRSSLKDEHYLAPLIVNYEKTNTYRIQVMDQHLEVLYKRVSTLFPEYTGWSRFYDEFYEEPTSEHAHNVHLAVKWGTHEIDAGKVTALIWLDDQTLKALIQEKMDEYTQQQARQGSPLATWQQKMVRIGYGFDWKLVVSQTYQPEEHILIGDPLVYARCPGLHTMCPDILIGPFHLLKDYSDERLRQRIETLYKDAIKRYGGIGIRNEESASPS